MSKKTILMTGSTDGIGLQAAKVLAAKGHEVILHGHSAEKLATIKTAHPELAGAPSFVADLSDLKETAQMAEAIIGAHPSLDVLINNAGVFKAPMAKAPNGMDLRFVVNTIAPYVLAQRLLPIIPKTGRILNLSSAAQMPIDMKAMTGHTAVSESMAYAQSKLAITMWSAHMAAALPDGPAVIAVNPASLLGTKMVKEAYGSEGKDIRIGSDILVRLALEAEFADKSGQYYDNDRGRFGPPHADALDSQKIAAFMRELEALLEA